VEDSFHSGVPDPVWPVEDSHFSVDQFPGATSEQLLFLCPAPFSSCCLHWLA
jgi:hypothetical protein